MKKKFWTSILSAAMACALCVSAAGAAAVEPLASSGDKESAHKTVSAGSYSYDCYTLLYYGSSSRGSVWAVEKNKKDAPAALRVYLYENDEVSTSAGWSTSNDYIHYLNTRSRAVSGDLRVEGEYMLYHPNGSDYTSATAPKVYYTLNRSADDREAVSSYPVNSKGETYGSYLDRHTAGEAPELIAAVGEDDVHGYVRQEDFAPELETLEEMQRWQAQVDQDNLIPLYDQEGNEIGTYALGTSQEQAEVDPAVLAQLNALTDGNGADHLNVPLVPVVQTDAYPTNAQGQTYGSYLDREKYGYAPDLIKAKGDNGVSGYLPLQQFRSARSRVLNLLDLNGSVVDTFTIEDGEHSS